MSPFRLTEKDFKNCRKNTEALQILRGRFKELSKILEEKLPPDFDPFKKTLYVSRIRVRGGDLREEMWLGMANSELYRNPREGLQFQFGIDKNGIWCMGIFLHYGSNKARHVAKINISTKRAEFLKTLKKLDSNFHIYIRNGGDSYSKCVKNLSEKDIFDIIDGLSRPAFLFIDPFNINIPKQKAIRRGEKIVHDIILTFKKLLPIYRLLSESVTKPHYRRERSIPSTELIYQSDSRAMNIVKRFERSEGREPRDVSTSDVGYDIISKAKNGEIRYIEVKSRRGGHRVTLTENELKAAKDFKRRYYLYVVLENGIYIIRNPSNCKIKKIQVTQYEVSDWRKKAHITLFR